MTDFKELARELDVLRDKMRAGEDKALAERRRSQELAQADAEARDQRKAVRGF